MTLGSSCDLPKSRVYSPCPTVLRPAINAILQSFTALGTRERESFQLGSCHRYFFHKLPSCSSRQFLWTSAHRPSWDSYVLAVVARQQSCKRIRGTQAVANTSLPQRSCEWDGGARLLVRLSWLCREVRGGMNESTRAERLRLPAEHVVSCGPASTGSYRKEGWPQVICDQVVGHSPHLDTLPETPAHELDVLSCRVAFARRKHSLSSRIPSMHCPLYKTYVAGNATSAVNQQESNLQISKIQIHAQWFFPRKFLDGSRIF